MVNCTVDSLVVEVVVAMNEWTATTEQGETRIGIGTYLDLPKTSLVDK